MIVVEGPAPPPNVRHVESPILAGGVYVPLPLLVGRGGEEGGTTTPGMRNVSPSACTIPGVYVRCVGLSDLVLGVTRGSARVFIPATKVAAAALRLGGAPRVAYRVAKWCRGPSPRALEARDGKGGDGGVDGDGGSSMPLQSLFHLRGSPLTCEIESVRVSWGWLVGVTPLRMRVLCL